MYDLPTSITMNSQEWPIRNKADFRVILDCFLALGDEELTTEEKVFSSLIIFYEDLNSIEDVMNLPDVKEAFDKMSLFFNCGQPDVKSSKSQKLIDWEDDSPLIMSAINKVAGKEVRAESYVHWWTFMGYYVAIGECPLATIVSIRYKKLNCKKLEKWEKDFIKDNPQYFTSSAQLIAQQEAEDWVRQMWEGGGKIDG